jgi:hypothetical protein
VGGEPRQQLAHPVGIAQLADGAELAVQHGEARARPVELGQHLVLEADPQIGLGGLHRAHEPRVREPQPRQSRQEDRGPALVAVRRVERALDSRDVGSVLALLERQVLLAQPRGVGAHAQPRADRVRLERDHRAPAAQRAQPRDLGGGSEVLLGQPRGGRSGGADERIGGRVLPELPRERGGVEPPAVALPVDRRDQRLVGAGQQDGRPVDRHPLAVDGRAAVVAAAAPDQPFDLLDRPAELVVVGRLQREEDVVVDRSDDGCAAEQRLDVAGEVEAFVARPRRDLLAERQRRLDELREPAQLVAVEVGRDERDAEIARREVGERGRRRGVAAGGRVLAAAARRRGEREECRRHGEPAHHRTRTTSRRECPSSNGKPGWRRIRARTG